MTPEQINITISGRCKTCRFATVMEVEKYNKFSGRTPEWFYCDMGETAGEDPKHPESIAVAVDGEGCFGALVVREDFGCIQWTKK